LIESRSIFRTTTFLWVEGMQSSVFSRRSSARKKPPGFLEAASGGAFHRLEHADSRTFPAGIGSLVCSL
jgi:hypothetical protein